MDGFDSEVNSNYSLSKCLHNCALLRILALIRLMCKELQFINFDLKRMSAMVKRDGLRRKQLEDNGSYALKKKLYQD